MTRWNRILTVLLVAQLVAIVVIFWPRPAASGGGALLPDVEAGDVSRVTIAGAEGQQITLAREGSGWVLPDADGFPALGAQVEELLAAVTALDADRLVAQTASSHDRLGVGEDEFERRIELETAAGESYTLYVGTSPSFGATHVRRAGEDQVYLTSELSAQDASPQPSAWVDAVYFQVPADEMTELRVENEQGTFEFVKEGDTWTLADLAEGEVLDETAVGRLVSRAASVSLQRPLGREEQPDYGLTAPTAVVTVWTADGETRILRVGAYLPDESAYVVTSSRSPYYVTASEFSLSDFVESGRDDWLVQPTAVPEATPEGP